MRIEVNIEKKYFFGLLLIGLMVVGFVGVYAYNSAGTGGVPSKMGHSVDEMDWSKRIAMVNVTKICLGNDCREVWPSGGGGSVNLLEGNGIILTTEAGGTRINSTATGGTNSPWAIAGNGNDIYYNGGKVGIGDSTPTEKLEVDGRVRASGLCIGSDCIDDVKYNSIYKVTSAGCLLGFVSDLNKAMSFTMITTSDKCQTAKKVISARLCNTNCAGTACSSDSPNYCSNTRIGYLVG
jgi:hypothetical protein